MNDKDNFTPTAWGGFLLMSLIAPFLIVFAPATLGWKIGMATPWILSFIFVIGDLFGLMEHQGLQNFATTIIILGLIVLLLGSLGGVITGIEMLFTCDVSPTKANSYLYKYKGDSADAPTWHEVPDLVESGLGGYFFESADYYVDSGTLVNVYEGEVEGIEDLDYSSDKVVSGKVCKVTIYEGEHECEDVWAQCGHIYNRGSGPLARETIKD